MSWLQRTSVSLSKHTLNHRAQVNAVVVKARNMLDLMWRTLEWLTPEFFVPVYLRWLANHSIIALGHIHWIHWQCSHNNHQGLLWISTHGLPRAPSWAIDIFASMKKIARSPYWAIQINDHRILLQILHFSKHFNPCQAMSTREHPSVVVCIERSKNLDLSPDWGFSKSQDWDCRHHESLDWSHFFVK